MLYNKIMNKNPDSIPPTQKIKGVLSLAILFVIAILIGLFVLEVGKSIYRDFTKSPSISQEEIDAKMEWDAIQDMLDREAEIQKIQNQEAEDRMREEIYDEIEGRN